MKQYLLSRFGIIGYIVGEDHIKEEYYTKDVYDDSERTVKHSDVIIIDSNLSVVISKAY